MSTEEPQVFSENILVLAEMYSEDAFLVQRYINSDAIATVGSILEEYNDRFETYGDILQQSIGDFASRYLNYDH